MAPPSYVCHNNIGALSAYDGKSAMPVYTWGPSDFEKYVGETITPSMYNFMSGYVATAISTEALYTIAVGRYESDGVESDAVDAYYDLPMNERIEMHLQTIKNLRAEIRHAQNKVNATISCRADIAFDPTSPIYNEYVGWCTRLEEQWHATHERLHAEIADERLWCAEAPMDEPLYDHCQEV